jgi:3-isopropylmalate/(R)-2-methylmalate dehydratase large subunit
MTIEGGGRAGMIAPDQTTFDWVQGRPGAPEDFEEALAHWRTLKTDEGAAFDREITVDASAVSPVVTWGTNPGQVVPVTSAVPAPSSETDERSLVYMGLEAGTPMLEVKLDRVFIGSCTNARIGDLRAAAEMIKGRKVASTVNAMVVPGSQQVAKQAES